MGTSYLPLHCLTWKAVPGLLVLLLTASIAAQASLADDQGPLRLLQATTTVHKDSLSSSIAQTRVSNVLQSIKPDVRQIISAASSTDIVYERVAYVADTFGPRFSGTPELERAIDCIKTEMQEDGLSVKEEPVMVPRWIRGSEYAQLLSPRMKKLNMIGLGNSVSTGGKPIKAPVLVVSSFNELHEKRNSAAGRIIVFNQPFISYTDTVKYRSRGASEAAKVGAVAALVRSIGAFGLQTPHAGTTEQASIPAASISIEDAELLNRMQRRGQEPIVELYMEAHFLPDVESRNLIVEIEGSERPEEVVMFGGHIDSWDITDGAIDDAGGVMITWESYGCSICSN